MKTVKRNISIWLLGFMLLSTLNAFPGLYGKASAEESLPSSATSEINPSSVAQIAGGKGFTVLLKKDGTVWTWGDNLRGKLGGGLINRDKATPISALSNITAIAVGQSHSLALKSDGTVWAWGENTFGQLGDGTTVDHAAPAPVAGLNHITAISAGNFHSVALKDDGTVWSWGDNTYGQLGDGTNDAQRKPVQLKGNIETAKSIAAGAYHTLAIDQAGVVWGWGDNFFGELGYGFDRNHLNTPIMATSSLWHITQISAGFNFSMALKDDGTVLTWGLMTSDPSTMYNSTSTSTNMQEQKVPVLVNGLKDVVQIQAGDSHAVVVKKDGSIYTWGTNSYGQLGIGTSFDGTLWNQTFPNKVEGLPEVDMVGTGTNFTFALGKDGSLWSWGNNGYSQLGDGTVDNQYSPVETKVNEWLNPPVAKPGAGTAIIKNTKSTPLAAGDSNSFVIQNNRLYGWGSNTIGQLGDVSNFPILEPKLLNMEQVASISAGNAHTAAVKQDGTLWTWGRNFFGQLGDDSNQDRILPAQVPSLSGVVAANVGSNHTIALLNNGSVWSFGDNAYGQLGRDVASDSKQIIQLSNVLSIAAGANFNLALENTGKIWAWGDNTSGQLGDGTYVSKQLPVEINGVTGVVAVAAGKNFALALKDDGTVWSWGYNTFGQLGDGTYLTQTKPVQVVGLDNVKSIYAGNYHSLAIKNDGTVWTWGQNTFGQLGEGSKTNQNKPVLVQGIGAADTAAAGGSHNMVRSKDGSIWVWGANFNGQLGDNTLINRSKPILVAGLSQTFSDLTGHWAQEAVVRAVAKGYVNGYSDNTFRPDNSITRAEFVKMTAVALNLPVSAASADQAWYQSYTEALQKAGILQTNDLQAGWDLPITRQEIAALSLRAVSSELQKPNTGMDAGFVMQSVVNKGLLQGLADGNLAPNEASTRAQAVVIIDRLMNVQQNGK